MARKIIEIHDVLNYLTDHPHSRVEKLAENIGVTVVAMRNKIRVFIDAGHIKADKVEGILYYSVKPAVPFGLSENTYQLNALLAKARATSEART